MRYIEIGMAIYGPSRDEIEKIVSEAIEKRKKGLVADIVTFRADLAKALTPKPKTDDAADRKNGQGL
jgi:hypothetical protein